MIPAVVNLPPHVSGDTWDALSSIGPFVPNMSSAAASARLHFCKRGSKIPVVKLGTSTSEDFENADAEITIVSASGWWFDIPAVPPTSFMLGEGDYEGDFEVIDVNGIVKTTHQFTLRVVRDNTRRSNQ